MKMWKGESVGYRGSGTDDGILSLYYPIILTALVKLFFSSAVQPDPYTLMAYAKMRVKQIIINVYHLVIQN